MAAEDSRIRQADSLAGLRAEIEGFLASIDQPLFVEDGVELFDLSAAQWKLSVEFGKLILEVWNSAGSLTRRIEGLTYRDRRRMELLARKVLLVNRACWKSGMPVLRMSGAREQ
jgi:hypothetical protein